MNHIGKVALRLGSGSLTRLSYNKKTLTKDRLRWMSNIKNPPDLKMNIGTLPKGIYGQATCHTHPHLISEGHLTCGTSQQEYRDRRDTFVNKLMCTDKNKMHVIVIPAAEKQYMSDKIPYVFRQNSDFFYLTGCMEPSAILVLVKYPQTETYKSILFVNEKDSHAELWEGPRTGCAAAAPLFAVDEGQPVTSFKNFIQQIIATSRPAVLWYQNNPEANLDINDTVSSCVNQGHISMQNPQLFLHQMRVIKSPTEIELLKTACYIGSQSVNQAMACTKPGISEHVVMSVLEHTSRLGGAEHAAFPPVVAGGERATHIHYVANNQLLRSEEMLLVDSGCQRWLYNSDISRTWPVSGQFSKHHRILYELVLSVQKRLIELLNVQRPSLDQLFNHMCRLLGKHLQEEGILPRDIDHNTLNRRAYALCPHHVSHYLGLDVHDAPLVGRHAPVLANMLVTVEPGIYLRPDDDSIPLEFRGVGIRIEDDVLVTDTAVEVLTDTCVKEVEDIEALVGTQYV